MEEEKIQTDKMEEGQTSTVVSSAIMHSYSIPVAILIAAVMISGSIIYKGDNQSSQTAQIAAQQQEEEPQNIKVKITKEDHILGDPNADVSIVEYSDFQCPYCRLFWQEAYQDIKRDYVDTGKAFIVYRHMPLASHGAANISAQASECASDQGLFWEFHDIVFARQAEQGQNTIDYGRADLEQWASDIGVEMKTFRKCLDDEKYADKITKDAAEAQALGLRGTPSIIVNDKLVVGAQPYSAFQSVIDAEL